MLILLNIGDNIRNKESVTDDYDANVSNDDNYKIIIMVILIK